MGVNDLEGQVLVKRWKMSQKPRSEVCTLVVVNHMG